MIYEEAQVTHKPQVGKVLSQATSWDALCSESFSQHVRQSRLTGRHLVTSPLSSWERQCPRQRPSPDTRRRHMPKNAGIYYANLKEFLHTVHSTQKARVKRNRRTEWDYDGTTMCSLLAFPKMRDVVQWPYYQHFSPSCRRADPGV